MLVLRKPVHKYCNPSKKFVLYFEIYQLTLFTGSATVSWKVSQTKCPFSFIHLPKFNLSFINGISCFLKQGSSIVMNDMKHAWSFITYDVTFRSVRQSVFGPSSWTGSCSSCGSYIMFASLSLTCNSNKDNDYTVVNNPWFMKLPELREVLQWIMCACGTLCAIIMGYLDKMYHMNVLQGDLIHL